MKWQEVEHRKCLNEKKNTVQNYRDLYVQRRNGMLRKLFLAGTSPVGAVSRKLDVSYSKGKELVNMIMKIVEEEIRLYFRDVASDLVSMVSVLSATL